MKKIFLTLAILAGIISSAQVKIGDNVTTLDANSLLELESTTKGVLFPRVALTNTTSFAPLAAHVAGMVVYNTATTGDVTPGLYSNNGTNWIKIEQQILVQKSRVHTATTAIVWNLTDYSVVTTSLGSISVLLLPDATTLPENTVRCISNVGTGSAGWSSTAVTGITKPFNNQPAAFAAGAGCCFVVISGKWYLLSGRQIKNLIKL